jgi:UDP-N-acetylmuramyl pentapeptide phosphotransferase/UDP-N-acetylglucosamine-1-phosphate transferase
MSMSEGTLLVVALAGLIATSAATGLVLALLKRHAVLDRPNERSSHATPTPRGAGLAVIIVFALGWAAAALILDAPVEPIILAAAAGLAAVSWLDDLRGLPVGIRLLAHAAAVVAGLSVFPPELLVFQGLLPPLVDRAAAGLLWLWFVNLYNFMDGIDGITGVETLAIAIGTSVCATVAAIAPFPYAATVLIGAGAAGFLTWNWPPARIFLGDVGSVPLGFLTGWLLLLLALYGAWIAAAIVPLYYLADSTLTLIQRLARGEKVWHAHARHFYQRAARRSGSHARVASAIAVVDAVLIAAAAAAAAGFAPIACLIFAAAAVGVLLWYFGHS